MSATTTRALAGASVTLGSGGNFNLPATHATTQTGSDGTYSIQSAISYREECPVIWLQVAAPGYAQSSKQTVACGEEPQNLNVNLNPN